MQIGRKTKDPADDKMVESRPIKFSQKLWQDVLSGTLTVLLSLWKALSKGK